MFNLKSVVAIAFVSLLGLSTAQANEIDMSDLYATINAELTDSMNKMQQDVAKDANDVLVSNTDEEVKSVQTQLAD
ncbi:hypothetical protein [Shewanella aestuarii]|uniref:OmpH family outer membrane protein n=1 Tax=Shewanella aestuarii TaxID=1028752 RepID=A0A6G9QJJ1_9GAMM|nr:hypothetical protein [Shewanella aestuarii]QIR14031.1 hypothetical protein HBH39_05535 [Shewanella aestuarii]